ncbi:GFA family protein [Rhodovulum sp. DZ06]|uniref:GFA family protein n=1 Tax=Rhodovulum sp. DZ06 TaxID=3425126 RepID=UPI003D335C41
MVEDAGKAGQETHEGGCLCGAVRFRTTGAPAKAVACHCRGCQLRTGSALGVSAYFPESQVEILSGELRPYTFTTESGRDFTNHFCAICGGQVMWRLEALPGLLGLAAGMFDPPSFWFAVEREVFARSRASFLSLSVADSHDTSPGYAPCRAEDPARMGG